MRLPASAMFDLFQTKPTGAAHKARELWETGRCEAVDCLWASAIKITERSSEDRCIHSPLFAGRLDPGASIRSAFANVAVIAAPLFHLCCATFTDRHVRAEVWQSAGTLHTAGA
jgi:hypothetical protein